MNQNSLPLAKPQPILPIDKPKDSPLFVVLAILAFLATLTLLSLSASYRSSAHWSAGLTDTATIQIKPTSLTDEQEQPIKARDILLTFKSVKHVDILSKDHSQKLLRPWLGDTPLPDALALPILLHVTLHADQKLNVRELATRYEQLGIRADIDDHSHWRKNLESRARAIQILSILAFLSISIAIIAACVFATHAGITTQKTLMNVLHQIGTPPQYTARLFSTRFALNAFLAGCFGALAAFVLLFIFSMFFKISGTNIFFLPEFTFGLKNLYLSALVPLFMALISGLATWQIVMKSLLSEMYP
ncbi:MAG: hypothetical protein COA43_02545 [Robiginitomaculum sp.]|nr:MAG: hypothetical protein COA43_02545 [Robiginitomaculum sp.]